jgi:Cu/Ag efflux protein CusF
VIKRQSGLSTYIATAAVRSHDVEEQNVTRQGDDLNRLQLRTDGGHFSVQVLAELVPLAAGAQMSLNETAVWVGTGMLDGDAVNVATSLS